MFVRLEVFRTIRIRKVCDVQIFKARTSDRKAFSRYISFHVLRLPFDLFDELLAAVYAIFAAFDTADRCISHHRAHTAFNHSLCFGMNGTESSMTTRTKLDPRDGTPTATATNDKVLWDIVENRFVGMKSRGVYETPGGTILLPARRAVESLVLDKGALHLKDELMPRYAELIYNGFWFSPEREMLQSAIDESQANVTGTVRLKLYKGNVIVLGRKSPNSLYDEDVATFEADTVYDQRDAEGFIKLNALRLRLAGKLKD